MNNDKTTYLTQITSHDGPVWQLSWAHPKFGPILASAGFDKKVMVHQEQADGTWKTIYSFEDHKTSVNTCQFAPAEFGLILACGSCDGNVSIIYNQVHNSQIVSNICKFCALRKGSGSRAYSMHTLAASTPSAGPHRPIWEV